MYNVANGYNSVGVPNAAPVAVLGSAITDIVAGSQVSLDFSGSYDSDGTIDSYLITQPAGDRVVLTGTGDSRTYIAPEEDYDQDLVFQLIVVDDLGAESEPVTVIHSILAVVSNTPPTANAGPNQSVAAGATVQLDASNSTAGTLPISHYEWTQTAGDMVALEDETTATPTFTSPVTSNAQRVSFEVVAIDTEDNRSEAAAVHIDVAAFQTSAMLKLLDTRRWELHHDGTVQAFEGRANREAFRFKLIPDDGVLNDADGFFRFDQPGIDSVEVLSSTSSSVSSTDDPDMIREVVIAARTGDLKGEDPNNLELTFVLYVTGDSDGLVMTASEMVPYQSASYFRR